MKRKMVSLLFLLYQFAILKAQQVPDLEFEPVIDAPAYTTGKGPLVLVDEAHHNFHTITTRYHVFAKVLRRDGYRVEPNSTPFALKNLQPTSLLVIANAIHPSNEKLWTLPTPSAFSPDEIETVRDWVSNGGSLLLIADHMPFPGAAHDLAAAFGFTFYNGFASDTTNGILPGSKREYDEFNKSEGTLGSHFITDGKSKQKSIDRVVTFTGQAFKFPKDATSLLTFNQHFKILLPDTAWKFDQHTDRISANGFSQGAVMKYGKEKLPCLVRQLCLPRS